MIVTLLKLTMMKSSLIFFILFVNIIFFSSCQSKNEKLIVKKWDCIKIENLDPIDTKYQTPEDSIKNARVEAALKSLSWTFTKDGSYSTSIAGITNVQGTYNLNNNLLTCTTANNENNYEIKVLTENELTLSGATNSKPVFMHFVAGE
jgi:hypothetical protein